MLDDRGTSGVKTVTAAEWRPCMELEKMLAFLRDRGKLSKRKTRLFAVACCRSAAVPAWNDSTVVRLAQAAYEERHLPAGTLDTGRLAVFADALEEAGCMDADILGHLRGPGPHVRGCWAVDLCLGKS
jgi:hypothetical protein